LPTVAVKGIEQQAIVALHRVREQWITTRTARINVLRGVLREHGLLLPASARAAIAAVPAVLADAETALPPHLRHALQMIYDEIRTLEATVATLEQDLAAYAQQDPVVVRLRQIPGIGLLTATALVGTVGHIHGFHRARQFASWVGLTPRESSSGPHPRLGSISKRGDRYLRMLLTHGARAVLRAARRQTRGPRPLALYRWAVGVEARRGFNKATIAVANKLSRIVWAVWHRDVPFAATLAA
jgi:transposase